MNDNKRPLKLMGSDPPPAKRSKGPDDGELVMATIIVADEPFQVPCHLLVASSSFFKQGLEGDVKDVKPTVKLDEAPIRAFEIYVNWLRTGTLYTEITKEGGLKRNESYLSPRLGSGEGYDDGHHISNTSLYGHTTYQSHIFSPDEQLDQELYELTECLQLSDMLHYNKFHNLVIDRIIEAVLCGQEEGRAYDGKTWTFPTDKTRYLYKELPFSLPSLKFAVDLWVIEGKEEWIVLVDLEKWPKVILAGIAKQALEYKDLTEHGPLRYSYWDDVDGRYHKHEDGDLRCRCDRCDSY